MSFLLVVGKILACEQCKSKTQIKYEGGAVSTQIGDFKVQQQLKYANEFGQPNTRPWRDGYYLYDFGFLDKL